MKQFISTVSSGIKNSARKLDNAIQRQISGASETFGLPNKKVANFSKFQAAWEKYLALMDKFMEDMAG